MAAYGYVRVSTLDQVESGLSLEAQEKQIRGYAMMHDLTVDRFYVERGVSGWKPLADRPEGGRLSASLRRGDIILCPKLDRMFRSARDALNVSGELQKLGVSLHLLDLGGDVTGNGISRMFFTIVAAFAEFERDRIAERISDVKSNERSKGRFLGGTRPFGYDIDESGNLVPIQEEQDAIAQIIKMRQEGESLRSISRFLAQNGHRVSHVTVKRVIEVANGQ